MKTMLYADWMGFRQTMRSVLFIVVVFALSGFFFAGQMFFTMITVMPSVMVPLTLCSSDKAYGWDRLSLSLPVLRRDVVGSKFLLTLLANAAAFVCGAVLTAVYCALHPEGDPFVDSAAALLLVEAIAIALMGLVLAAAFKWGVEKSRYILLGCVWIPIIGAFALKQFGVLPTPAWVDALNAGRFCQIGALLIVAALALYLLCYAVSVQIYRRAEL